MSCNLLINALAPAPPRVAVMMNQTLMYLDIESQQHHRSKGNIYLGTITSIEPSLDAVFVNYGYEKHGFLPVKEIANHYFQGEPGAALASRLRLGQRVLVQIEKERRGDKGAALTTFISLAGAYLVLMPYSPSAGGVSKKADAQDRDAVREQLSQLDVPDGFGVIVRTAGVHRTLAELQWDFETLITHWRHIEKAAQEQQEPCLIHRESDSILKAVRDLLHPNIDAIVVDDADTFQMLHDYLINIRPEFVPKLSHHRNKIPLFTHYQVEEQIERLFLRKLELPTGGEIVIDYAEALTAIDVNSARATKGHHIEETALQTNLEAAKEIARQLRLRDIGGIVVIDFIDMHDKNNRQKVEQTLLECISIDRAKIRVESISSLTGCLMLSRQRVNTPISETNQEACWVCHGQGLVRTIHSAAQMMLRKLEENAASDHTDLLVVQLPVVLATYLLNECREQIQRIQQDHQTSLMVIPNEQLVYPKYLLKRHKIGKNTLPESKKQIDEKLIHENIPEWSHHHHQREEPKVTQHIMKHPSFNSSKSLWTRWVEWLKGLFSNKKAAQQRHRNRRSNHNRRRRFPMQNRPHNGQRPSSSQNNE